MFISLVIESKKGPCNYVMYVRYVIVSMGRQTETTGILDMKFMFIL